VKHNQRIGKWGEDATSENPLQKSYEIIGRNVRTPYGEIDIVARQGNFTIFVDVKTRTSNKMGLPEESITAGKRGHMIAYAEHYAVENEIDHWQIDVISIEGKSGFIPKITYFENAI